MVSPINVHDGVWAALVIRKLLPGPYKGVKFIEVQDGHIDSDISHTRLSHRLPTRLLSGPRRSTHPLSLIVLSDDRFQLAFVNPTVTRSTGDC